MTDTVTVPTLGELVELDGSSVAEVGEMVDRLEEKPFAWLLLQTYLTAKQADSELTLNQAAAATLSDLAETLIAAGVFEGVDSGGDE